MTALSSGTGLGLRSVRQRLHAKHGQHASVHVHASRGRGVRVTLRFPAVAAV
jgi:signal transduction histidine kinase